MQINVRGATTEVKLTVLEKRRLREAASFMEAIAKHTGGADEKACFEALQKVAGKWAPEGEVDK